MTGIGTYSQIESLEARIAPAGIITVTFENGSLVLTSDNGSHNFSITALDATTTRLLGTDGTVFHIDGQADLDTAVFTAPPKSLSVTLGSEADSVSVSGLNVAGDIAIDLGDGLNALTLDTFTTKRGLKITGGAGDDDIEIEGGLSTVKKDLAVDLKDGVNGFNPGAVLLNVGGSLSYTGGSGADVFSVSGDLNVKGSVRVNWGGGNNEFKTVPVVIPSMTVGKDLTFDSAASTSAAGEEVDIGFNSILLEVKGDLRVVDGAGSMSLIGFGNQQLTITLGDVSVVSGAGTSSVNFVGPALTLKSLHVDASESSQSSLSVAPTNGSLGKKITYIGGEGTDVVSVQTQDGKTFKGASSLNIDLGNGSNSATVFSRAGFFTNVAISAGTGEDFVLIGVTKATMKNLQVDLGDGPATTNIGLRETNITGQIKVTNGTGAGPGILAFGVSDSQIGGISIASNLTVNNVGFLTSNGLPPSNFTVKKAVTVTTGNGADTVFFDNVRNAKFLKGIKLDLGDGTNLVSGALNNTVSKSLTIIGGSGNDTMQIGGTGNLGAVNVSQGAGSNSATFSGSAIPLAMSSLTFASTSDGMAIDQLVLTRIQVLGKLDAQFGAGVSSLAINDSTFGNRVTVDTGAGNDTVMIDADDSNAGTILAKAVEILLGGDDDTLTLGGGNAVSALVIAKSTFRADGGSGTNTVTNNAVNVFAKEPELVNFLA